MLVKKYLDGVEILSLDLDKLKEVLKKIASQIRSEKPFVERVILFGSLTTLHFTPYSDIDVAIIVNKSNKKFLERQDDFIDYFITLPFDVNIVVYTTKEIDTMLKEGNRFINEVLSGLQFEKHE